MMCFAFPGRQVKLTEMKTDFTVITSLTMLSDDTVAACGGKKLMRLNLETGRTLSSTDVEFLPFGMGEVKFRSKPSLVLSYA